MSNISKSTKSEPARGYDASGPCFHTEPADAPACIGVAPASDGSGNVVSNAPAAVVSFSCALDFTAPPVAKALDHGHEVCSVSGAESVSGDAAGNGKSFCVERDIRED